MVDRTDIEALRREVQTLRERVAELQRRAARFDESGETKPRAGLEVSTSEREELLVEAERIAHMGSWVWNVESNAVFWSDELFRILGYDPVGDAATTDNFFARVHPADRERVQKASQRGVAAGVSEQVDYRVLRPDGNVRYVTMDGALLFDDAGKLRRIVGTVLDITEAREVARQLEEANCLLRDAQAFAHLGTWSFDVESGARSWSPEVYRILGVPEGTLATAERFIERIHEDDRERLLRIQQRAFAGAQGDTGDEAHARVVRPSGEVRYVRIQGKTDRDAAGRTVGMRGTMLDVTDLTLLQQRLARAEKLEAIGRLAGGIAHDFNNLLMVIRSSVALLHGDTAVLGELRTAIDSASTLTSRLLAFGRQSPIRLRSVDLNEVVKSTLQLVGRVLGEQVVVRTVLGPVPRTELDPDLTSQALINLLINARDAMPQGGDILLTTRRYVNGQSQGTELSVQDSGPGIDDAARAHVFEPFFTTKTDGEGTGLGLAMVHGAVAQQGGSISLEAPAEGGTRFILRFPETRRHATPAPPAPASKADRSDRSLTVLLVEDNPSVRRLMHQLLEREGYQVLSADRPSLALEIFRRGPAAIDLVISDLIMPEMSGPALIKEMENLAQLPNVLFISGYGAQAIEEVDSKYEILLKPFGPEDLRAAIERLEQGSVAPAQE